MPLLNDAQLREKFARKYEVLPSGCWCGPCQNQLRRARRRQRREASSLF